MKRRPMTTLLGTGVRRFDSCFFRQGPETTDLVDGLRRVTVAVRIYSRFHTKTR